jgi:threonine/homoserine/homoserine lactone efflux protein
MVELYKGLLFGLLLSFLLGPVFFALLQTSIEKGFKAGLFMAIGISLSDSLYLFITYTSVSFFSENNQIKFILGLMGAIIMIGFGLFTFLKPVPKRGLRQPHFETNNYLRKIVKGFLLNGINPFMLIFWLGVAGMITIELHYSFDQAFLFYVGVIFMVLSTDITKAFLANKIRDLITPRFMKMLNRSVGIGLIMFGFRLLYFALELKHLI